MKCYVATYYQYNNYGTRLQNYALIKTLQENKIEAYTLYLLNNKEILKYKLKYFMSSKFNFIKKFNMWRLDFKKGKIFTNFNKNLNFLYINSKKMYLLDTQDSFAIAGSDQIWSPNHLKNNKHDINLFFLRFISENKRFSYASSFGVSKILGENNFYNFLKEFNIISVREEQGKSIVNDLVDLSVEVIPDPVFLLSSKEWYNISTHNNVKDYIVIYFLSSQDDSIINSIKSFANILNLSIISIAGNCFNDDQIIPDPLEFVGLISDAKYVFTDSFHASVFSIIFGIKFTVFTRTDVNQMSRIDNLLIKYNCKQFIYDGSINSIQNKQFPINTKQQLEVDQKIGLNFLNKIIEEVKKNEK